VSTRDDIRFDSWKEIAAYLNRDLRTVRRWEKERALPVRRVPGGRHRAIYAFRREIDAWLLQLNEAPRDNGAGRTEAMPPLQVSGQKSSGEEPNSKVTVASATGSHFKLLTKTDALLLIALTFIVPLLLLFRTDRASGSVDHTEPIEIVSVSRILPMKDQTIVIRGFGFGLHTPYMNTDTAYIAIRDKTVGWAAGRIIPQNWDEVTLNVQRWEDAQIVVTGFSGAYGSREWKLNAGDDIEVAIWNPQSGRGPALYHLTVSRSSLN